MDETTNAGSWYSLPEDWTDAVKVGAAQPQAVAGDAPPWWAQMMYTGISKVIDNQTSKPAAPAAASTSPGTAAGQSGQTYQMTSTPTAPAAVRPASSQDWMPWVLGLGVVLLVLQGRKWV